MFAKTSWLCFFAAAGLLVWGVLGLIATEDDQKEGNALIVEEPERNLGEFSVGTHVVELQVRNTSRRPHRILGLPDG